MLLQAWRRSIDMQEISFPLYKINYNRSYLCSVISPEILNFGRSEITFQAFSRLYFSLQRLLSVSGQ